MQDAWRAYLEVALGLTEASRKKAQKIAGDLVGRGGATAGQLQSLAEDVLSTGMANREALTKIVRYEVDRALGMVGLATADEVAELTDRVRDLERQLQQAQAGRAAPASVATAGPTGPGLSAPYRAADGAPPSATQLDAPAPLPRNTRPVSKAVAKKTAAKKTAAKKTAAKKTAGAAGPADTTPVGKAVAKRTGKAVAEQSGGASTGGRTAAKATAKATAKKAAKKATSAPKAAPPTDPAGTA